MEKYKKRIDQGSKDLVKFLVNEGGKSAAKKLDEAGTTGVIQDTTIVWNVSGKQGEVAMQGSEAGFIEFGTGTHYTSMAESHPLADKFGAIRGEWHGDSKGADPPWFFYGEPGTYGEDVGNGFVKTFGNPANRVIYNTGKELGEIAITKAKEVFKND